MPQTPSIDHFVCGVSLTLSSEPKPANTEYTVQNPPRKIKRSKRPATSAESKSQSLIKTKPLLTVQAKKLMPRPKAVVEVDINLSDLRMNSFCKAIHIDANQPLKIGIIDAWTSNGHTMFRAIGNNFEAIFKSSDDPFIIRMLAYGVHASTNENFTFPVKESFLTPNEIIKMFANKTLQVSL